jgi:hypothetical protein
VPGIPGYFATREGFIYGPSGHRLAVNPHKDGYHYFSPSPTWKLVKVHRAVALAFHGPPPESQPIVRHLNGDPSDNRPENLAWGTQSENMRDAVEHGTDPRATKTHCLRDHLLDEENTYRWTRPNGRVMRRCRKCSTQRQRDYRADEGN